MTSHQIADREEARAKIATSTHACCSARKLRWLIIAAFGQCVCEFPSCSMRHDLRNTLFLGQALILNTYEAGCVTYFSMKQWVSCFVQLKFRPAFLNSQYLNCCRVLYHTFIPHWTSLDDSGCRMFSCFRVIFFPVSAALSKVEYVRSWPALCAIEFYVRKTERTASNAKPFIFMCVPTFSQGPVCRTPETHPCRLVLLP